MAILYVGTSLGGWKASPGALTWLKSQEKVPKKKKPAAVKAKGPTETIKKSLLRIRQ